MKSESGIYDVMSCGINRQSILEDDEDCEKYLQCLQDCKAVSGFELYGYCLMGNYIHLLIRKIKEPLPPLNLKGAVVKRLRRRLLTTEDCSTRVRVAFSAGRSLL